MFIANKKLRSLCLLRHTLVFIANKTPLASLAPSKFVSVLMKTLLASLAPSKPRCIACCRYVHRACLHFGGGHAGGVWLFERPCSPRTTLTHGSFLICLGSTLVSLFFEFFWVPNFWLGPSLGPPTWARHGPTHLGHPRGPGLGSPTWARFVPQAWHKGGGCL